MMPDELKPHEKAAHERAAHERAAHERAAHERAAHERAGRSALPTVLYVDDEELARKYFVRAAEHDFHVVTAGGVDEALAILAQPDSSIEVLVTDYRMPGRAGGELLRQAELDYPHLVRILVTAYADKDVLLETINGGAIFRILEKPLDAAAVRGALHTASDSARERTQRRNSLLAIDETVAFLAQELNAPLSTIASFARGIQRRVAADAPETGLPLKAELGNAAAHMNDNARYCLSVLSTLADSVRRVSMPPAIGVGVGARQLVQSVLDVHPLTPRERAAITLDVAQDFTVGAAPNCVALVLTSVLSQSLRALGSHAAPVLTVTIGVGEGDGQPRIVVVDNGPGLAPAILNRMLLDPVAMHADTRSHGWSMIFCQRVMQSFGGQLRLQSEQGRSTTVTLNFPVFALEKEPA